MTTQLAFVPGSAGFGRIGSRVSRRGAARVCETSRQSVREPHVDVLWRLTTSPWARARTAIARPARARFREAVENAIVIASALAVTSLNLGCLAGL